MSAPLPVEVRIDPDAPADLTAETLRALARFTLRQAGVTGPLGVSLVIADDATIRDLHARHIGIDEPTDVLTFALAEEADAPFVSGEPAPLLGEVVVSYETAAEQAAAYGHSPAREVAFLCVHGLLHLLGHDDASEAERSAMLARQEAILAAFERQGHADA